ncbi:AmpG family muropeptide MFS transporter [Virgifigura deserti]|uniref:AmpG family muropeptide MFS transporter n=1 Tax=Virgifigura deserti TaxID=2268457 RepID=UPI003CCC310D
MTTAPGKTWLDAASVYRDRRMLIVLLMGFASGLPLLLTLSTLSIWLTEEGVTLTTIGLFALVGTPYAFKFLWAPLIDRAPIPLLTRALGRRRSWMLTIQAALIGSILFLGATRPAEAPLWTALAALLVSFFSASQDIVIDAYRIEILEEHQQGAGAAVTQFGYRIGLLASGAGALFLAAEVSWFWVYAAMAALMLIGLATALLSPEPRREATSQEPGRGPVAVLREAVIEPFAEFFTRRGVREALLVLAFILLYKFGDAFAGVMANPFYVQIGFTKAEIASVSKIFGLVATLLGVFIGGAIVGRYGVLQALLICGILQMVSNLMFAVQAAAGADLGLLTLTIGIENLSGGMGSAAFVAYLSVLCNVAYTATQYALFSSFMAFGRTLLSSSSGWVADNVDWVSFFVISTVVAIPGLLLLLWMMRRFPGTRPLAQPTP